MPTELLLAAFLAAAPVEEHRVEVAVPAEVTLVGLTYGVRPEVLIRPGERGTVSRLRVALGVLVGKEQLFLPLSLGYRAVFRQEHIVQPEVGLGIELQHRFVDDLAAVRQFGLYLEGGVGFRVGEWLRISLALSMDLMLIGGPGVGLGPRLAIGWVL